jgi:hypothetical protein
MSYAGEWLTSGGMPRSSAENIPAALKENAAFG